MKKKSALFLLTGGVAVILSGCGGSKGPEKDYSKYVSLGDYNNISVERVVMTVTDDDVQTEIQNQLSYMAEYEDITGRAAQDGDLVLIDFEGTVDGEPFEDGSATDYELEIGSDSFIEGFEDQIIGMEPGETKEITVTFPEPYDGVLDGKEALFTVTLNSITEIVLPDYNDEFVSSISDYTTVAAYEEGLRAELTEMYDNDSRTMACNNALYQIIDASSFSGYPEDLYEQCAAQVNEENQLFAEAFGLEDVSELYGEDYDPEEAIVQAVNERMVVSTIAAKEKLTVTEDEYTAALESEFIDSEYNSLEEMEKDIDKDQYTYDLLYQKVLDFLAETVTFEDVSEDEYYGTDDLGDVEDDFYTDEEFSEDDVILDDEADAEVLDADMADTEPADGQSEETDAETEDADAATENTEHENAE